MIKKFLFFIFAVILALIINWFRLNNGNVIVDFSNYQIVTTTNFLLCSLIVVIFCIKLLKKLKKFIFRPENLKKKITNYTDLVVNALFSISAQNFDDAKKYQKKAKKIFDNNLTEYLEYKIFNKQKDFINADKIYKQFTIKELHDEVLQRKLDYEEAKTNDDIDKIIMSAENLFFVDKRNANIMQDLLNLYIKKCDWKKVKDIFAQALKMGAVSKKSPQFFIIAEKVGEYYYNTNDYNNAKYILKSAYSIDKSNINIASLLAKTYLVLNKKAKARDIIIDTWRYGTSSELLNLYYAINNKELYSIRTAKKLVKINPTSFESQFALARAYFFNKDYHNARDTAKNAEKIAQNRDIYSLMLKIEQEDGNNSATIALIKAKMLEN
ncbi:MAG: hypothetical protein Ta2D_02140 [Rickettsiales bacterium]|nr:MAG: hypothetical protein Ta2D_02140 [Rickettsiales bacterium]